MHVDQEPLYKPDKLVEHLLKVLNSNGLEKSFLAADPIDMTSDSAVMVLLGRGPAESDFPGEPCLILNKRSQSVRQPGDLCCPGGSLMPRLDGFLARLIKIPFLPLGRWRLWPQWKRQRPAEARTLALLLATGLRECVEEMRLNPFGIRFLGPLPPHRLRLFRRRIYPMVGWVSGCQKFRTNWEVDKIVYLPLHELMNTGNFYRYRLRMGHLSSEGPTDLIRELPSYRHQSAAEDETLWGATYHIIMKLLALAFEFTPPELADLPVLNGSLNANYLTGAPPAGAGKGN